MNLNEMTIDQLEERKSQIVAELDNEGADLNALEEEARAIKEELETRKAAEAQKAEIRAKVASGEGKVVEEIKVEEKREMTLEEVRASKDYINAFANYIKTDDDSECRALLSTNATDGQVPVPTIIEGRIRTAWERAGLMELVTKTYVRGNLKIGFELSATGAEVHAEGDPNPPAEEVLTFGVITMVPESIKKWITISDEALDLGGEEFLDYIYDEITYQIAKKAEALLIGLINDAPAAPTVDSVSVASVEVAELGVATVATALGLLSGQASNPVIVTTRENWSALKVAALSAQYAVDPYEGLPVHFVCADALGDSAMIVGDFGLGAHANFPNGNEIRIKFDDLSLAEKDLVKIVGRESVALGLVADKAFVKVTVSE